MIDIFGKINPPFCIILFGFSLSGKTTLANDIVHRYKNTSVITEHPKIAEIKEILSQGKNIVFDD